MNNKKEPALLVMAAGLGSRYGGLKQMDPIGPGGEIIIDYSLYDAKRAGFKKAVFVISKRIENDFKELIANGAGKYMDVSFAIQSMDDIPQGFSIPEGREKPWGTGHAVYSARKFIDGPFAVINADDYYGPSAFKVMYDYLSNAEDGEKADYCMAGYLIENTVTENGTVSRGICSADKDGNLASIVERTKIRPKGANAEYTEDGGESWTEIKRGTLVSMNLFGFTEGFMKEVEAGFPEALTKILSGDRPLKDEYFLPSIVERLIKEGKADVKLLSSPDKWYGITYKEDRPEVVKAMEEKTASGLYPKYLWK